MLYREDVFMPTICGVIAWVDAFEYSAHRKVTRTSSLSSQAYKLHMSSNAVAWGKSFPDGVKNNLQCSKRSCLFFADVTPELRR
jgi:hypothetical protein